MTQKGDSYINLFITLSRVNGILNFDILKYSLHYPGKTIGH